jgi:hypothetical protein
MTMYFPALRRSSQNPSERRMPGGSGSEIAPEPLQKPVYVDL